MPNEEKTLEYSDSAGIIKMGREKKAWVLINSLF